MKKIKIMFQPKVLKIFKWVFVVIVGAFIILVIIRFFHYFDVQKTNNQVLKIHSTKLNMVDVTGDNLPSDPGIFADKTIQGVDSNSNDIRDDMEIAIFKEYPNSAKTRAVLLQYALALQMEITQPFQNTVISTEVVREQSRAFMCVGEIFPDRESNESYEKLLSLISLTEDKQFNTKERQSTRDMFLKNVRSFSDLDGTCDVDLSKLPN